MGRPLRSRPTREPAPATPAVELPTPGRDTTALPEPEPPEAGCRPTAPLDAVDPVDPFDAVELDEEDDDDAGVDRDVAVPVWVPGGAVRPCGSGEGGGGAGAAGVPDGVREAVPSPEELDPEDPDPTDPPPDDPAGGALPRGMACPAANSGAASASATATHKTRRVD
jgi:hypothetical protein